MMGLYFKNKITYVVSILLAFLYIHYIAFDVKTILNNHEICDKLNLQMSDTYTAGVLVLEKKFPTVKLHRDHTNYCNLYAK